MSEMLYCLWLLKNLVDFFSLCGEECCVPLYRWRDFSSSRVKLAILPCEFSLFIIAQSSGSVDYATGTSKELSTPQLSHLPNLTTSPKQRSLHWRRGWSWRQPTGCADLKLRSKLVQTRLGKLRNITGPIWLNKVRLSPSCEQVTNSTWKTDWNCSTK